MRGNEMEKPNQEVKKILMLNYEFPPVGGRGGVASKQLVKGLKRFEKLTIKI